jgi:hypothetical protein
MSYDWRFGEIEDIRTRMGSGILTLVINDDNAEQVIVHGDNGPTVEALMAVLGHEIVEDGSVIAERVIGQRIRYVTDGSLLLRIDSE